jgi:hypothetical protein
MIVHVLFRGYALCGFSQALPRDWPEGHRWVHYALRADATCASCREQAEKLSILREGN